MILKQGKVTGVEPGNDPRLASVSPGMTPRDLLRVIGPPAEKVFSYSEGRESHCARALRLRDDRVVEKDAYYYFD